MKHPVMCGIKLIPLPLKYITWMKKKGILLIFKNSRNKNCRVETALHTAIAIHLRPKDEGLFHNHSGLFANYSII